MIHQNYNFSDLLTSAKQLIKKKRQHCTFSGSYCIVALLIVDTVNAVLLLVHSVF